MFVFCWFHALVVALLFMIVLTWLTWFEDALLYGFMEQPEINLAAVSGILSDGGRDCNHPLAPDYIIMSSVTYFGPKDSRVRGFHSAHGYYRWMFVRVLQCRFIAATQYSQCKREFTH